MSTRREKKAADDAPKPEEEVKPDSPEEHEASSSSGGTLPNLYNRFVQSFESALNTIKGFVNIWEM